MAQQPLPTPKPPKDTDKVVEKLITSGGRPGAQKDFNNILRRAAKPKKK